MNHAALDVLKDYVKREKCEIENMIDRIYETSQRGSAPPGASWDEPLDVVMPRLSTERDLLGSKVDAINKTIEWIEQYND